MKLLKEGETDCTYFFRDFNSIGFDHVFSRKLIWHLDFTFISSFCGLLTFWITARPSGYVWRHEWSHFIRHLIFSWLSNKLFSKGINVFFWLCLFGFFLLVIIDRSRIFSGEWQVSLLSLVFIWCCFDSINKIFKYMEFELKSKLIHVVFIWLCCLFCLLFSLMVSTNGPLMKQFLTYIAFWVFSVFFRVNLISFCVKFKFNLCRTSSLSFLIR